MLLVILIMNGYACFVCKKTFYYFNYEKSKEGLQTQKQMNVAKAYFLFVESKMKCNTKKIWSALFLLNNITIMTWHIIGFR